MRNLSFFLTNPVFPLVWVVHGSIIELKLSLSPEPPSRVRQVGLDELISSQYYSTTERRLESQRLVCVSLVCAPNVTSSAYFLRLTGRYGTVWKLLRKQNTHV